MQKKIIYNLVSSISENKSMAHLADESFTVLIRYSHTYLARPYIKQHNNPEISR